MRRDGLTKAQRSFLEEIAASGSGYAVESYPPRRVLIDKGYLRLEDWRLGDVLRITEAGRAALRQKAG